MRLTPGAKSPCLSRGHFICLRFANNVDKLAIRRYRFKAFCAKKYIAPAVFLAASASNFIGLSIMWTKAMVCADIGHTCRLTRIDSLLITVLSYPVQSLPDDVLRSLFGDSILSLLLINAVAWGVGAVVIMRLLLRFAGGAHTAKAQEE